MTISECIDDYILKNKDYLKERTIYSYTEKKKHYVKVFGDVDIGTFTQEFIQCYITNRQKQGAQKRAKSLFYGNAKATPTPTAIRKRKIKEAADNGRN